MTEADAIAALRSLTYATGEVSAPNVNALGHESDFLLVTRAGRVYEYEVKLTASDFKADFKGRPGSSKWARQRVMSARVEGKVIGGWSMVWGPRRWEPGEELTSEEYERRKPGWTTYGRVQTAPVCPHRFYYCYPEELHEALEPLVPAWAGIVVLKHWPDIVRKAKNLHTDPLPDVRDKLLVSTNHRYWRERRARRAAEREKDMAEGMGLLAAARVRELEATK